MLEYPRHVSKAIAGFPMGDKPERTVPVYLPPGYSKSQNYPVVFFLAGFSAKGATYLTDDSAFGTPLPVRFDEAISERTLPAFIGVFPDCTSKLGHSQYVNSPAFGNYNDYLCDELTAFIDDSYATYKDPAYRVLVGHSSGGFGALITGMQRPDSFHWIGASAADGFFEHLMMTELAKTLIEIQRAGSIEKLITEILAKPTARNISGSQFSAILLLAMAPCYAPNVKNPPLYGDLFFDAQTGEIRQDVWEKYLAWDPIRMVDRYAGNLGKLKGIQLECGMQDEHALLFAHRQLSQKLKAQGIIHELVEYPGTHSGHHWRYEGRLERLLGRMLKG